MTTELPQRYWDKVEKTENCWFWHGTMSNGYGQFFWRGKRIGAHRLSYEHAQISIPKGLQIDHLCRVPRCVNPEHLEAVTSAENTRRGNGPAARHARKTHCIHGHEFTPENTRLRPNARQCRTCERGPWRRYRIEANLPNKQGQ